MTHLAQGLGCVNDDAVACGHEADVTDLGIEGKVAIDLQRAGPQDFIEGGKQFAGQPVADFEAARFYHQVS